LEKHGLITWGPDGSTSYLRTIRYVSMAERFFSRQHRRRRTSPSVRVTLPVPERREVLRQWLPAIRRTISQQRKMCVMVTDTPEVLEFVNTRHMPDVARVGPATPDHLLRTKRFPLVVELGKRTARDVPPDDVVRQLHRYAAQHARYFQRFHTDGQAMQDPSPRVILIPGVGMLTTGKDATDAEMVAQIYTHAMSIMRNASAVGRYTSISAREAFGVEYWPLELYKLSLAPAEAELSREIVLITGAAGGIGQAIAERLIDGGASVVVTDLHRGGIESLAERLNRRVGRRRALGLVMDVTDEQSIQQACDQILNVFGGIDMLVSNAGVAVVAAIDRLTRDEWEQSLRVNATGHFLVAQAIIRWLRVQGLGGALVFVASKNVLAPGKDFGAYSAAKAAQAQLAKILAIENGEFGIRVNIVNPDGVFEDSGLWKRIKAARAKTYRLPPSQLETYYQQRNLLKARVLPEDVAEAVCFFVSKRSAKTTGCLLTVDGGLREAFPR
jgi:rhamnulose-1-phosphate aldolase/alcohol dehydrogenase